MSKNQNTESSTEQSTFLAWMFRMPLIKRWALMFCVKPENVAEHSHQVAIVAHLLAVIKNKKFNGNINADRVATIALYHEASEVFLSRQKFVYTCHFKSVTF
jgi:5'-deoxynucleotidase YfbR-like HD superfamily hydrolase